MEVGGGLCYQSWDCGYGGRGKLFNLYVWGTRKFGSIHRAYFTPIPNPLLRLAASQAFVLGVITH